MDEAMGYFQNLLSEDLLLQIVYAIVVLVLTAVVVRIVARLLRHVLQQETNPLPSNSIFINIARAIIWIFGLCFVLAGFGVDVSAAITALGVGGIAISLGFQDTLSNLIGGLQVSLMKIVEPGDNIEVSSKTGVVKDVSWRHTTIVTSAGETVVVPNSIIGKNTVVKLAPATQLSVKFVLCGQGDDLDERASAIECACRDAVSEVAKLAKEPKVVFTEVSDRGLVGKVSFSIKKAQARSAAIDAAVRAIAPLTRGQQG